MQITFGQYFKSFSQWLCPIYWISGEGDGRLDIEEKLFNAASIPNPIIKRIVCKKKDELIQIKDHFRIQDLFNERPLLVITVSSILCSDLIDLFQSLSFTSNDKVIVYSPKLTPKTKSNAFWTNSNVAHYALWPYSQEQASLWWKNQCRILNINPSPSVTQSILLQTGYRIDELRQVIMVWQLQYPNGGEIDVVPPGVSKLSDKVYDEAYDWLLGAKVKEGFDIDHNMPFYFALKQTIDEVVQFTFLNQSHSVNVIMKKLGWWPQKLKNIQNLSKHLSLALWLQMIWTLSQIEMARLGASSHSFRLLMDCFYHRQQLPLESISAG